VIEVLAAHPLLLGLSPPISFSRSLGVGPPSLISPTLRGRAQLTDPSASAGGLRCLCGPPETGRKLGGNRAVVPGHAYKQLGLLGITE